ncbi:MULTISPECIES: hypothetical protein [Burkholderia]|uniref:hypothetical protein n=1 Tax=Burkholderia TaxID=32008 RepID=UPI00064FFD73|nr:MULTISPECIES: hypothetical protein [Burkholderia]KML12256.1 hypothetical protein VL00_20545 [Burkholderia cepacia]KML41005.1 hypothetical protein VL13_14360 [Burkholderia lata]KMN59826.1 hypothetical protein VK92_14305 [Burkholderia sp. LK4]
MLSPTLTRLAPIPADGRAIVGALAIQAVSLYRMRMPGTVPIERGDAAHRPAAPHPAGEPPP